MVNSRQNVNEIKSCLKKANKGKKGKETWRKQLALRRKVSGLPLLFHSAIEVLLHGLSARLLVVVVSL